jgi:hypothetical protein
MYAVSFSFFRAKLPIKNGFTILICIFLHVFIHSLSKRTFNFATEALTTHNNSILFQNKDQLPDMKSQVIPLLLIIA